MKKMGQLLTTILITSIILLPSISSESIQTKENNNIYNIQGKGYRYNIQGWIYLHIEGEPYERGYQYGFLVGEEIADSIERWKEFIISNHEEKNWLDFVILPKNLEKRIWEIYIKKANSDFLDKVPEEYIQEMKGMTKGVQDRGVTIFDNRKITFDDILVMQFVQDIMYSSFEYKNKRIGLFNNYFTYRIISMFSKITFPNLNSFLKQSLSLLPMTNQEYHPGHCSAFIATGEYAKNGEIVAAHSTVFNSMMAQRCNLIVNIKPSNGYAFTMATFPGSVWSQEDWYQNEKGIILTETELPQGPFDVNKIPKGVRSRTAIQYSESIDDVIRILQKGNNGLIPNEWLIGDAKTGEIASLQQAYFNTPLKRTYNGFYGSFNVPHTEEVQAELFGLFNIIEPIKELYYNAWSHGRDKKFEELKEKYKGKIDSESAKEILATYPICNHVTDGKITTSNLLKNNGLIAHIGNPNSINIIPSETQKEKYSLITELPALGWVEFYSYGAENTEIDIKKMVPNRPSSSTEVIWHFNKDADKDFYTTQITESRDDFFAGFSNGNIVHLSMYPGHEIGRIDLDSNIFDIKVSDEKIFIGSKEGIVALDEYTKKVSWDQLSEKRVHSLSKVNNGIIYAGCKDGSLYALDSEYGLIQWHHKFEDSVYVSNNYKDNLFFSSGDSIFSISKNGRILWSFDSDGIITSSPVYNNGRVYFGSWDNKIYCLDEKDGSEIWNFKTNWGIGSSPEITKNQVFVGGLDNNLYALDKKTGELEWFYKCRAAIQSKPVTYGDYVFFGSDDGRVYALDKKTGENIWNFAPGYTIDDGVNNYLTSPILSDIILDNGVLYFAINNEVYALNAQTFEKVKNEEDGGKNNLQFLIILIIIGILLLLIIAFYVNKNKRKNKDY